MRILFIGTVNSSKVFLEKLISFNEDIVGVITKKESSFNSDYCDLSIICEENNIDYLYVNNTSEKDSLEFVRSKKPDVIYCFGWSHLISKEIISIPPKGIIGYHPAELPNNRGRHPVVWALVLGLKKTASTFFYINEGTDTGDIISQETVEIEYGDDAGSLYNKLLEIGSRQIEVITRQINNNEVKKTGQDPSSGNFWRKRDKEDGRIDWRMSSRGIYNLVRGLAKPYIGAHFVYNGNDIKVWKVEEVSVREYPNIEPGKVLEVYGGNSFLVKVGDGLVKVIECDKTDLKVGDYLR